MKKLLSLTAILLMMFALSASAQSTVTRPTTTTSQATTRTQKKTQPANPTTSQQDANTGNATDGNINGHDYVDLGLPSGLKWATCNVGAKSPEERGYYFEWGSITPKVDGVYSYIKEKIDIGGNPQYDAAAYFWKGSWRMPTKEDWIELLAFCTQKAVNLDGNVFAEFTGPSGKSILIPLAGYNKKDFVNELGEYWTSKGEYYTYYVHINNNSSSFKNREFRGIACPIRPVSE